MIREKRVVGKETNTILPKFFLNLFTSIVLISFEVVRTLTSRKEINK